MGSPPGGPAENPQLRFQLRLSAWRPEGSMIPFRRSAPVAVGALVAAACTDRPAAVTEPDLPAPPAAAAPMAQIPAFQAGVVVVRFAAGAAVQAIAERHGAAVARSLPLGMRVLSVPIGRERTI